MLDGPDTLDGSLPGHPLPCRPRRRSLDGMKPPWGSPEWIEVVTAAEHPDLWERARREGFLDRVWPEYNHHGK